jgi:hypothetical protein
MQLAPPVHPQRRVAATSHEQACSTIEVASAKARMASAHSRSTVALPPHAPVLRKHQERTKGRRRLPHEPRVVEVQRDISFIADCTLRRGVGTLGTAACRASRVQLQTASPTPRPSSIPFAQLPPLHRLRTIEEDGPGWLISHCRPEELVTHIVALAESPLPCFWFSLIGGRQWGMWGCALDWPAPCQ